MLPFAILRIYEQYGAKHAQQGHADRTLMGHGSCDTPKTTFARGKLTKEANVIIVLRLRPIALFSWSQRGSGPFSSPRGRFGSSTPDSSCGLSWLLSNCETF